MGQIRFGNSKWEEDGERRSVFSFSETYNRFNLFEGALNLYTFSGSFNILC